MYKTARCEPENDSAEVLFKSSVFTGNKPLRQQTLTHLESICLRSTPTSSTILQARSKAWGEEDGGSPHVSTVETGKLRYACSPSSRSSRR